MPNSLLLAVWMIAPFLVSAESAPAGPTLGSVDFAERFGPFDGCFVMSPIDGSWTLRYGDERCDERIAPCSTFKIFNALAALDCGAVKGPDEKIAWDGGKQWVKAWEQDHTLATAIRDSVLWYFQELASRIGVDRMRQYLNQCDYGNRDMSGGIRRFWLGSSLKISANEQVRFLQKLYTGRLPFKAESVASVREMITLRTGNGWTVSGKTGSDRKDNRGTLGWFVGHVRCDGREYIYAVNIKAEDDASGFVARRIAFEILETMGLTKPASSEVAAKPEE